MNKYKSKTINGGTTVVLDSLDEAIQIGRDQISNKIARHRTRALKTKITVRTIIRDKPTEKTEETVAKFLASLEKSAKDYERSVSAISEGNLRINRCIMDKADELLQVVSAIEPTLAASYAGFERSEDGIAVDVGLLAAGEDRPFFQRSSRGDISAEGHRGRAYRLVLCTDVSWFGKPDDNAAAVGALVLCLQRFGPVELWIQQGWLGEEESDGVTLFKLDFSQGFQPTQLAFWCGHEMKDDTFSFEINMGLGRNSSASSKSAEIPADLFLRGDWMKVYGVTEDFYNLLHTEQLDILSKWIAETAMKILTSDDGHDGFTF